MDISYPVLPGHFQLPCIHTPGRGQVQTSVNGMENIDMTSHRVIDTTEKRHSSGEGVEREAYTIKCILV